MSIAYSFYNLTVSVFPGAIELWKWLTEDVLVFSTFQIPVVTWIGAVGLLALFVWHGCRFVYGMRRLHVAMNAIEMQLLALVHAREQESPGWLRLPSDFKRQRGKTSPDRERSDLDDLAMLDRILGGTSIYAQDWLAYRR